MTVFWRKGDVEEDAMSVTVTVMANSMTCASRSWASSRFDDAAGTC